MADSAMSSASEEVSCGGAVAGSIFGTIACIIVLAIGAWFLYKKYWKNKTETNPLVEDAENSKVDYAFDNPAFKGDNNKNNSPFDNKWKTPDKRKTVDDSYANATIPRLVPLRGSDFTGLGIEVCGGLKDGIYVKKVMPQGPAANIVHRGDKITSITIDFRHIVQEDAATILSYASPYNVQLELIDSNGAATNVLSQNVGSQPALAHPLYRPRSQEDLNTIERNARKKLFSKDDNSYPTLKMDQQQHGGSGGGVGIGGIASSNVQQSSKPRSPATHLPQAHEENEKKNSLKKIQNYFIDMVEEKFQTKASASSHEVNGTSSGEGKKGMKFGIRVLPPSLIGGGGGGGGKSAVDSGKSPNKVQADNDNNANIEKIECTSVGVEKVVAVQQQPQKPQQQQQQEQEHCPPIVHPAPPEAMKRNKNKASKAHQAAAAKASTPTEDMVKPTPFERQASINSSGIKRDAAGIPQEMPTELMQAAMTAINNRTKANSIDRLSKSKGKAPIPPLRSGENGDDEHEIDNVDHAHVTTNQPNGNGHQADLDCAAEFNGSKMQQIELNSKHITVHQASEEEEETSEERKTASLGDLSKCASNNRHQTTINGTLERAQSLEMSADSNNHIIAGKVTPKKRKSRGGSGNGGVGDLGEVMELKEPRYSEPIIENLEPLHTVRLKSSYEWGNLEDAIYDGKGTASDDSFESDSPCKKLSASSMDMMSEVLAAADKFDKEINDIELNDVMDEMAMVEFDMAPPPPIPAHDPNTINPVENAAIDEPMKQTENKNIASDNGIQLGVDEQQQQQQNITQIQLPTTVHLAVDIPADNYDEIVIDSTKSIPFGSTNVSDDAKASRYTPALSSLERPKSEVLKQLIAQHIPDDELTVDGDQMAAVEVNGISYSKSANHTDGQIQMVNISMVSSDGNGEQVSPVFSSNGSGINNISISSIESDIQNGGASQPSAASSPTAENRITILTSDSQPSSIVIEDETLNFKMQTLSDEGSESTTASALSGGKKAKNEVFIVESLSSKKEKAHETTSLPVLSNGNGNGKDAPASPTIKSTSSSTSTTSSASSSPPTKGFVTEIRFPNANKDKHMNAKNLNKSLENRNHSPNADTKTTTTTVTTANTTTAVKSSNTSPTTRSNRKGGAQIDGKAVAVEEEYIPRNNEIRFTTSTYQSPRQFDKRNSQIDQIRSNFERSHTSEIPIPIRKISTPSTPPPPQSSANGARVSPSKIPVFTSQKSSDNLLKNSSNANRVSVSVTSIKNSSRNPSGK